MAANENAITRSEITRSENTTSEHTSAEITEVLDAWSSGDPRALDRLMPLVFDEVRELARRHLRRESPAHTLQPTALVNEVYVRLTGLHRTHWENRRQFFGELAKMMRRLLVDHARRHLTARRGAGAPKLSLDEALLPAVARSHDLVALDDALAVLAELHPRQHQVVELKFFMGLTREEIAEVLDVAVSTVIRDWANARVWLLRELSTGEPGTELP